MAKVRYQVIYGATKHEPLGDGCFASVGWLEVEQQTNIEASDRAAYLLATNSPGELVELLRVEPSGFAWREGMAIPGERITSDMVGMTFAQAITRTLCG